MSECPVVVLYAEDSEDDAFLMRRAFTKVRFPGTLTIVPHGLEALAYLEGKGPYGDRAAFPLPRLILLDVKMPHLGGLDVLKWIRAREAFHEIPVLMLTSSSQRSDIAAAYAARADCYLVKPADLNAFRALVEDIAGLCGPAGRTIDPLSVRGAVRAPAA